MTRRSERSSRRRVSASAVRRVECSLRTASGCVADVAGTTMSSRWRRPVSVSLPAGWPTAELTDSRRSHPGGWAVGLPALAFCLLFRFQGAVARAHTCRRERPGWRPGDQADGRWCRGLSGGVTLP
jgi:hypothetical protein